MPFSTAKFLRPGGIEDLPFLIVHRCALGEPCIVEFPAVADEFTGFAEAVRAVENDDDQAAWGDAFGAILFGADEWIALHAGCEAGSGKVGGAGFDADYSRFAEKLVGVSEGVFPCAGGTVDADLAGFLLDHEVQGVAAHGVDGDFRDIGCGGIAYFFVYREPVGAAEKGLLRIHSFGEVVHLGDEGLDGITISAALFQELDADVMGDGKRGLVIGSEHGGVECIAEGEDIAGSKIDAAGRRDLGDDFRNFHKVCGKIRTACVHPIDGYDGGGDFREGCHRAFFGGVLGRKDLA